MSSFADSFEIPEPIDHTLTGKAIWSWIIIPMTAVLLVALIVFGFSYNRQRNAISVVEELGGFITTATSPLTLLHDPAIDYMARGSNQVIRVQLVRPKMTAHEVEEFLAAVTSFPQLRTLRVGKTPLSDEDLTLLKQLPFLDSLDLDRTRISDVGLREVAQMRRLEWLVLDGTLVTDAGLAQLRSLESLKTLSLENTAVTDAGIEYLMELPALERVHLAQTEVTNMGLDRLRMACPGLEIIR